MPGQPCDYCGQGNIGAAPDGRVCARCAPLVRRKGEQGTAVRRAMLSARLDGATGQACRNAGRAVLGWPPIEEHTTHG